MKSEILAKLRNVLAKLYPDEASMRRISHDGGLDLTRVSLNSSAINNWYSILVEAEKLGHVDALLAVIQQEYGSNQEFTEVCKDLQMDNNFAGRQISFIVPLGNWEEVRCLLFNNPARIITKVAQKQFQSFDWAKAEEAYLNKIIKLYDRVRILGSSADIPLGNLFTQVYILDKPTARYRYSIEELHKRGTEHNEFQRQQGERIYGLDLVKTGQNLFILGKPGAGKTTFLKYITIQAAHKQLPQVPIFVSLNQWSDSRWGKGNKAALLPFLVEQFDICDFPDADLFLDYLLRVGRALVLFDGLDEVKQEKDQRRRLTSLLQDFAHKYDQSQHLITCRIAANEYAFSGFADVEVADFISDQVNEYARSWFGDQEKKFSGFTVELAKPENKGLAELCNTPLLLSLLCLTFDNDMRFPPSRAELYEDALETLLRKWDSNRSIQRDEIYRALSHKRKLQLLMNIAEPTFTKGELFFRQRDLEKWIVDYLAKLPGAPAADMLDGTTLLKAMEAQHSILVERAQGIYSFSHLTFQEYLTARYLAENQGNSETTALLRRHLTDQRWREVFLLTASLLDDADAFVTILREVIDSIAANSPILIQLLAWAQERTQMANAPVERQYAVQLAYIFLTLARTYAGTLTNTIARTLDFARTLALALDLDLNLDFARALALENEIKIENARDLDLARNLARATTPLVGFDYGLYYAWSNALIFASASFANASDDITDTNWQKVMQAFSSLRKGVAVLAEEGQRTDLAQRLLGAPIPLSATDTSAWQHYADALFAILHDEHDPGPKWAYHATEIDKFSDYLYANELLVQCLKVAAVSDRKAVLQGLLLPPEGLKGEGV